MTLCGSVNVILNHPRRVYYIKHTAVGTGNLFHQRPSRWQMGLVGLWRGGRPPKNTGTVLLVTARQGGCWSQGSPCWVWAELVPAPAQGLGWVFV